MHKISSILYVFFLFLMVPFAFANQNIKHPNVSGRFYSSDPKELSSNLDRYFNDAAVVPVENHVDVIIAPHAGYMYSGSVAAYSFKSVSEKKYKTIIILAPSHHFPFDGVSVWQEGGFKTPLGTVGVDQDFAKNLILANEKFYYKPEVFKKEHSLEVEIPFLQKTFNDFKIVPVIFGQPSFDVLSDFAKTLVEMIGSRTDVLIVVSTDLSHYHSDEVARKMDQDAISAIKELDAKGIYEKCVKRTMEMCGFVPVTTALLYAQLKGLNIVKDLKYANSSDVTKDKKRVVGYSSIILYQEKSNQEDKKNLESKVAPLSMEQKRRLLKIARETMESYVRDGKTPNVEIRDARLREVEGAFVTIHKNGRLRGCIGNIIGSQPLCLTVRDMAISSATKDTRFKPLKIEELDEIKLEVSVLSKPWKIKDIDEIQMGVHGVIISQGRSKRGVFLPQVATETGWSKEEFLSQLCSQKAGLPSDAWKDPKVKIEIFTADVFSEEQVK